MREFASPGTIDLPTTGNLTDDVVRQAEQSPERALLAVPGPDGWTDVTADRFHDQVRRVARGLAASGIERGDRVLLLCSTRYEWTLFDYAIWFAGAVSVPVYVTSSPEQVAGILEDSGAIGAVVESAAHADLVRKAAGSEPGPRTWCVDGGAVDDLTRVGAAFTDDELETRRRSATPDTVATLVYTSGTTGRPQGCMLTHGNLMAEVRVAVAELDTLFQHDGAGTLLLLPPAHVFARVVQVGAIHAGVRLGHTGDVRALMQDLASFRPTFVLAVPRVFEKVFTAISQQAAADGRGRLFDRAVETAIAYSRASDSGRPGPVLRARHAVFERRVYAPMRATLGGRCRYAVSGGAPLGERLTHFFRGAGLTILEGYGLTETTAAVTVNRPDQAKLGSVGRPLGGVTVRVGDEGELQVRGPQVFPGYWNAPEATDDVLDDEGWLRTGDLGEIDDEGFVRVTGRKKEILVTAGGKNVAPSVLEDRVRAHPLVDQCLVVGDGRPFIAALVTLDTDAVAVWAQARGKDTDGVDPESLAVALADDEDLRAEIQAAVDDANAAVSQAESIRRFAVLPAVWTEEGGHLTPSLKLRRATVLAQTRTEVEDLYER